MRTWANDNNDFLVLSTRPLPLNAKRPRELQTHLFAANAALHFSEHLEFTKFNDISALIWYKCYLGNLLAKIKVEPLKELEY
jgi:hypothetical protein